MVNFLNSLSATSSAAASATGAEDPTSTSIAAERLRLALASPPLGAPAGSVEVATASAAAEGERTRYGSRDPFAPPGLHCCDPDKRPSLRDGGLRFLAGKNCDTRRGSGFKARKGDEVLGLGFYLVDMGARGARRHCGRNRA